MIVGIVIVAAAIAITAYYAGLGARSGYATSGYGSATVTPQPTIVLSCGTDTTPDCSTALPNQDWTPIPKDTAAAAPAVSLRSALVDPTQGPNSAQYQLSRPETSVVVRQLCAPSSRDLPDM